MANLCQHPMQPLKTTPAFRRQHTRALAAALCCAAATQAFAAPNAAVYRDAVLAAKPTAYWTLDTLAGNLSGTDLSGNAHHATPLGGAGLPTGLFGGAAAGKGSYLQVPLMPAMTGKNAVSVEAWVKLDASMLSTSGAYGSIFDSSQDNYVMYLDKANGELRFKVATANGHAERPGASATLIDKRMGQWMHVVGQLDPHDPAGPSAKLYLNGVLRDRHTAVKLNSSLPAGQLAAIGADWANGKPTSFLNIGVVDHVAVYDKALSEAEMRQHYILGSGKTFEDSAPKITSIAKGFEVIAHRGNSMFAPENSLASNRQAMALGAHRFETDIRLSKDGVAVISHDDTTTRVSGINKKIAELTAAELKALSNAMTDVFGDKYKDEKIPTLAEVLQGAVEGKSKVVLDVKVNNAGAAMAKALAETGFDAKQAVAFAWNDIAAVDLVQHLGDAEVFHLGFVGGFRAAQGLEARGTFLDGLVARGIDGLALSFTELLNGGEPFWGDLLALANSRGLRVFAWTVNEAETMADLISLKSQRLINGRLVEGQLSGIITDDPGTALALVSSVPEPATVVLMMGGLLGIQLRRRSRA